MTSPQEWTIVGPRPKGPKKDYPTISRNTAKSKRLILIRSTRISTDFSPLALRNAFNKAFLDKGVKDPVVATVSRSLGQNIVVTTA